MKQRLQYIDCIKGFCIILMVMGHVGFGTLFSKIIHSFHMPIFFFLSGLFFKTTTGFFPYVKKKTKTLLLPYFFVGIFSFIIYCVTNLILHEPIQISLLFNLFFINTEHLAISEALWFLTSLFFCEVMYYFIVKIKSRFAKIFLIIVLFFVGVFVNIVLPFRLPYGIDASLVGLSFFACGHEFMKSKYSLLFLNYKKRVLSCSILVCLLAFFLVLSLINNEINMRSGLYKYSTLFWVVAFGISICLFYLFRIICDTKLAKFFLPLSFVGNNSLIFLCLNQLIIFAYNHLFSGIIKNIYLFKIVIFLISVVSLFAICLLINNTMLACLFGKRCKRYEKK